MVGAELTCGYRLGTLTLSVPTSSQSHLLSSKVRHSEAGKQATQAGGDCAARGPSQAWPRSSTPAPVDGRSLCLASEHCFPVGFHMWEYPDAVDYILPQ